MRLKLPKSINKDPNFIDCNSRKAAGPMKNRKNKRIPSKKKQIEKLLKDY
jgi:hypothetical protein